MSSTFYTGNSGQYTTGPHLDFKVWDVEKGTWVNPNNHTSILRVNGKPLTEQFGVTSGYGMRTHPTRGGQRMHHGIDYGTPGGTAVTVDGGTFVSTYRDPGGGITSQYAFVGADGRKYDAILQHGSDQNSITSDGPVWYENNQSPTVGQSPSSGTDDQPSAVAGGDNSAGSDGSRQEAIARVESYKNMSKSEMDSAYDQMRKDDPVKAASEGMKMHRAYFNK